MLASQEYPDLIGGFTYTSGISAAIDDDIILELRDDLPTYAPDYWALLIADDGYNLKGVATDDGEIGVFASISTGSRGPEDGLMTRMNWLEEQGLEVPTTFDEATEVLTALAVAYDLKDPLYMTGDGILDDDQLAASFGVALKFDSINGQGGFYIGEDDRVHFGYCEQGFIDYIQQMKDWYDAGIISKDFTSNSTDYKNEDLISEIMAGETAIFSRGDGLMDLFRTVSGDDIQAIPDFVVNEGDTIHLGNAPAIASGSEGTVITTGCEEPELAMQFLNWWYTEDGQRASIYGIEGVSYYIDDNGDPQYTEMMTSTEGQTLSSMRLDYCGILELRPDGLTPEASYSAEAQEAPVIWGSNKDGLYEIPDGVTMTVDEGDDFSKYFSDISTYCQEMTCKFITGAVDMSEIEAFQSDLKNMGVQECCAIYEDAIARYNAR
jgi:putative aldouronate transport system substrate-binding protein